MARADDNGTRTFIDGTVLEMVQLAQPHGLSRTGYINYLIQLGLAAEAKNNRVKQETSENARFSDWCRGRHGSTRELLEEYNKLEQEGS